MKRASENRQALYITGIYLVLGLLWLGLGYLPLQDMPGDPAAAVRQRLWPGSLYLLLTAPVFYLLLLRVLRHRAGILLNDSVTENGYIDLSSMAPLGIFSAEKPGELRFINERAAGLLDLPVEKCLGLGWHAAIHESDRDRLRTSWGRATGSGGSITDEFRIRRQDGSINWLRGTAAPQYDAENQITCFLGILTDITNRKVLEEERDRALQRLKLAVDAAQVGLWDWDMRSNKVYYSPEWKRQIGYADDEIGDSFEEWHSRVHPDDIQRTQANANSLIEKGSGELSVEFRFRHKDGSYRWILALGSLLLDENGEATSLLGAHVDITDRKLAELDMEEGLRKYSELAELSPIGIFYADARGKLIYNNTYMYELIGIDPGREVLGDEWMRFVYEADRERVIAFIKDVITDPREFSQEFRIRDTRGNLHWISERGRPVFNKEGELQGFIGTVTDITPVKEALEDLRRSETFRRLIIDMEPESVSVLALDGSILEINPAGLRMLDAGTAGAITGRNMLDLVLAEQRQLFREFLGKVVAQGEGVLTFHIRSLNGEEKNLEMHAVPLREEDQAVRLLGITRDVTEQMRVEARVRESEQRFQELFETNSLPMCIWDPETFEILAVNDAMIRQYGYSREELLAMKMSDIRPSADLPIFLQTLQEEGKDPQYFHEIRHLRKNGEVIEVMITAHPTRYGNRVARVAQIQDVTEQRRVEKLLEQERMELREKTKRLDHLLTTGPTLVFSVYVRNGVFSPAWISDNVERILGYTREEALQQGWWENNLHPDDRERTTTHAAETLVKQDTLVDEFRFIKKSREVIWIRVEARKAASDNPSEFEIVGSWSDITAEVRSRERLRLDSAAFASTRDGVVITDKDAIILSANKAVLTASGYTEEEVVGHTTSMFRSGRHDMDFYQSMWAALKEQGYWQGEIWNRKKTGEVFPVWLTISSVNDELGYLTHYVAIYTDISELKKSEEQLHRLAHYDPLTGLPNRLLFQSRLEHAIEQARRRGNLVALIFLDLDDFKKINDSLGHIVGDEMLIQAATRLKSRVRDEDTLARLGGDEFVVLLEVLEQPQNAATLARDLLASLEKPFKLPSTHELHVHGSIGISIYPDDGQTPAELIRAADTAMYRSKEEGGDRFLFYTNEMSMEVVASLEMENALRQGLARSEFELYYQPILDLASGEIRSAEALLRWDSALVGQTSPVDFIPVAERTGLIVPIGDWVIDAACRQFAEWREQGLPTLHISFNVSARQFRSPRLLDVIEQSLARHGVAPECLVLELTESMLMERPAEAAGTLTRLKEIGVRRSLDDFGTGFSSLAYLTRFPVDTLKIDASFVQDIEIDPSARKIITAMVELAHSLGMATVAEGVETEEQMRFLQGLGCTAIQGYLLSPPLPAGELMRYTRSRNNPGRKQ